MEQTVSKERTAASRVLYALSWAAMILIVFIALFCAANVLGADADGGLAINWLSLIACLLLLAGAGAIWRVKDRLNTEYDYAIRDGRLEVTAVLNNRRRVPKLKLELGRIHDCGSYDGRNRGRPEKLYPDGDAALSYVCFEEKGEKRMALLALNDDMIAALRRGIQRGVWHDAEGKN